MEFDEHKNYVFWDNIRDIDWKASSKSEELFIKKYEVERDLSVLFVLDNSETMTFWSQEKTKKETLKEVFYSLAISAYTNNDNIWGFIFDENNTKFIPHKKSKNNIYKILEKLLGQPDRVAPTKKNVGVNICIHPFKEIINRKIKNNLIFILTDKAEKFDKKLLKNINNQNEIIIINIFDSFENELIPHLGKMGLGIVWNISLNLWKSFLNIELWNKQKISDFQKIRKNKLEKLKYNLEKSSIWYIKIDEKSDILKELILYFNKNKWQK